VETSYFGLLLGLLFAAGILISVITNVQGHIGDLLGAKLQTLLI
jgi:hypothetical protein